MSGETPPDDRPDRPVDLLGRTIAGKFVVEEVIGTGAMGVVYRARQTALDKIVAIKVMHVGLVADETFAVRFHREAKAASRLDHPNSIRILDFGQEPDGRLYIAMDYLAGRDLLEVINHDWPLPVVRTVDILAQALSALAVAHDLSVLHRDLKPENIMVLQGTNDDGSPADTVKVCDFGIAKIMEREEDSGRMREKVSTGGVVVGTPAYMSPEQARGEALDARSDVYAIGVILYQMLTMRVPFDAPTPLSTLLRLVNEEPERPSSVSSYVDPKLEAVCLKAISKKPADRYQSAREMRAAIRALGDTRGAIETTPAPGTAARQALQAAITSTLPALPVGEGGDATSPPRAKRRWSWIVAAVVAAATIAVLTTQMPRPLSNAPAASGGPASIALAISPREVLSAPAPPGVEVEPPRVDVSAAASAAPPVVAGSRPSVTSPVDPASKRAPTPTRSAEPAREEVVATTVAGLASPPIASSRPVASIEAPSSPPPRAPAAATPAAIDTPRAPDPALARVEIGAASNTIGTTATSVNKAIGPAAGRLVACYHASVARGVLNDGPATLHLETNEEGVVTDARIDARIAAPLAGCITGAVRGRKIANVDTGSASADVPLVFRSR